MQVFVGMDDTIFTCVLAVIMAAKTFGVMQLFTVCGACSRTGVIRCQYRCCQKNGQRLQYDYQAMFDYVSGQISEIIHINLPAKLAFKVRV